MAQPLLEVHFQLSDGNTIRFAQSDPASVQNILAHVQHGKIFTQPSLVLAGTNSVTAIQCAAITRLDLVLQDQDIPQWLLDLEPNGIQKREISLEQFLERVQSDESPQPGQDQSITLLEDIRLVGGTRCTMEVHLPVRSSHMMQRQHLLNVFSLPSLSCRRLGGGISILNPAQIMAHTYHPGLEPPAGAWPAESLDP